MEIKQNKLVAVLEPQTYAERGHMHFTIPWGAIIAGVIISLGIQILLNFLGIALGMATLNHNTMAQLKIVETSWLLISSVIAMCIGGWFVGAFSIISGAFKNACYGAITWCIVALVAVFITTNVSNTFMGSGLATLSNNDSTIPASLSDSQEQYHQPQFRSVVLDSQIDERIGDEQVKQATKGMGKMSLILFFNFLVGLIASALGAIIGDKSAMVIKFKGDRYEKNN